MRHVDATKTISSAPPAGTPDRLAEAVARVQELISLSRDPAGEAALLPVQEALLELVRVKAVQPLVENLPQNLFTKDREGRFTFGNGRFCASLGKSLDEIIGKTDHDFYPPELADKYREDDRRVLETGEVYETVEEHAAPDGRRCLVQVVKAPIYDSQRHIIGTQGIFWDVTAKARAEQALLRQTRILQSILDHMGDGVVVIDEYARSLIFNPAAERILGGGLAGTRLDHWPERFGLCCPDPETLCRPDNLPLARSLCGEDVDECELYVRSATGLPGRWISLTSRPLRDEQGRPRGAVAVCRDISEHKRVEDELVRRAALAALGADIGVALTETDTLEAMLQECTEAIVRHLDAAFARIWTLNKEENVLELQASAGMYTHLDGPHSRIPVGQFKIGRIAQERRPHLTNDVPNDAHISDREWAQREGMVAFAGHPLVIEDRLVGVLGLFSRRLLLPSALDTLAATAKQVALGIERKWAEEELTMRARQRAAVAHLGQHALTGASLPTLMNEVAALIGLTLDVEYCEILELLPDENAFLLRAGVGWDERQIGHAKVEAGLGSHAGFTLRHGKPVVVDDLNRETRFPASPLMRQHGVVSSIGVIIYGQEGPFGVLGAHSKRRRKFTRGDVHFLQSVANVLAAALERGRSEQALRESEARYQWIFDEALTGNFVSTPEGQLLLCNPAFAKMFGFQSVAHALGVNITLLYPSQEDRRELLLELNEKKRLDRYEHELVRLDGQRITVIEKVVGSFDETGALIRQQGYLLDITQRKRAEDALERERDRLAKMLAAAAEGIVIIDDRGAIHEANDIYAELLGYDRAADVVGLNVLAFTDEKDADRNAAAIRECFAKGFIKNFSFSYVNRQGGEVPINLNAAVMQDDGTGVPKAMTLVTDFTELKRNQEEFRIARQIQQRLFPSASPIIPGFDIAGRSYPANSTSGDYYDYIPMLEGRHGIVIGDASGHGVGPALLSASTRAYLRSLAATHTDVSTILAQANQRLAAETGDDHYVTLLFARLEPATRTLVHAGAGHRGYVLRPDGSVHTLESTAPPLGIDAQFQFPTGAVVNLQPGDLVFLLTDGIVEATSPAGAYFGIERAFEVVRAHAARPASEIVAALYQAVCDFTQEATHQDDITAVLVRVL